METEYKKIQEDLSIVFCNIKKLLMNKYKNLYFYISPTGNLTVWIRSQEGKDGIGINTKLKVNVCCISHIDWEYLDSLNKLVEPVYKEPDKYFYCTECGEVKRIEDFEENIFAAYYCKECSKKPDIANLIKESKKAGFYD